METASSGAIGVAFGALSSRAGLHAAAPEVVARPSPVSDGGLLTGTASCMADAAVPTTAAEAATTPVAASVAATIVPAETAVAAVSAMTDAIAPSVAPAAATPASAAGPCVEKKRRRGRSAQRGALSRC